MARAGSIRCSAARHMPALVAEAWPGLQPRDVLHRAPPSVLQTGTAADGGPCIGRSLHLLNPGLTGACASMGCWAVAVSRPHHSLGGRASAQRPPVRLSRLLGPTHANGIWVSIRTRCSARAEDSHWFAFAWRGGLVCVPCGMVTRSGSQAAQRGYD
jgi:hypothetical protein